MTLSEKKLVQCLDSFSVCLRVLSVLISWKSKSNGGRVNPLYRLQLEKILGQPIIL